MKASYADELPLSAAAQRLGVSWQRAWRMVLTGELVGRQVAGRWLVDEASIDRCGKQLERASVAPRVE